MAAEATNQTKRVLDLLTRFNKGETVYIDSLYNDDLWLNANNKPVNERTITRALGVIKEYFPHSFNKPKGLKGVYQGIANSVFSNLLDTKVLSFVTIAYDLSKKSGINNILSESEKSIIEAKLKESNIIEFLKKIQTPFSTYKKDEKNEIGVLLKINAKKARFFKNKKFLKSQKIEKNLENGDIVVKFTVTNFNEITSFILSWLPNVEVIEPKELKDELNTMLKSARI